MPTRFGSVNIPVSKTPRVDEYADAAMATPYTEPQIEEPLNYSILSEGVYLYRLSDVIEHMDVKVPYSKIKEAYTSKSLNQSIQYLALNYIYEYMGIEDSEEYTIEGCPFLPVETTNDDIFISIITDYKKYEFIKEER